MNKCLVCNKNHKVFKNGRVKKTCDIQGRGIGDLLSSRPKSITDLMHNTSLGSEQIISVRAGRTPLTSAIQKIVPIIAKKNLNELKQKYHFDKLFHLFLFLKLSNNTMIRIEKNERVMWSMFNEADLKTIPELTDEYKIQAPITVSELLNLYEKTTESPWHYTVSKHNCQKFASDICLLLGHNLDAFILVDVSHLLPEWSKLLANFGTDMLAIINYLTHLG